MASPLPLLEMPLLFWELRDPVAFTVPTFPGNKGLTFTSRVSLNRFH
jgi:hypothetical protein